MAATAPLPTDPDRKTAAADKETSGTPRRGRLWTAIAATAVFSWILWTIGTFVLQRLDGEPLSPTCSLEIRRIRDSKNLSLAPEVLLSAADFRCFRGVAGRDGECRLILKLNARGIARLPTLRELPERTQLAVVMRGIVIAVLPLPEAVSEQPLELHLREATAGDANEIFARLTE